MCISVVLSVISWAAVGSKSAGKWEARSYLGLFWSCEARKRNKRGRTFSPVFLLQPLSTRTSPSFRLKCKQVLHNSVVVTRQQPLPSAERGREGAGPGACVRVCARACHFALLQHTRLVSAASPRALKSKTKQMVVKGKGGPARLSARDAEVNAGVLDLEVSELALVSHRWKKEKTKKHFATIFLVRSSSGAWSTNCSAKSC